MPLKILLAEDEQALAKVYATALRHKGHDVVTAENGQLAVEEASSNHFDLQIFDIMMPVKTGIEALEELRSSGNKTHTVLLTAMGEIEDKVKGLDSGADDYLTKPISLKELLARVDSLERRLGSYTSNLLQLGNVSLNITQQELSVANAVRLSSKETKLMEILMLNHDKALTTDLLFTHVWAEDEDPDIDAGYVYIYISYLRQKLRAINGNLIITGDKDGSYQLLVEE